MPPISNPSEKIILALDGMNRHEALSLIAALPDLLWVKVGLELFVSAGPEILNELRNKGKKVFLDLKFHDIPNTMARSCYEAASKGVELITVHACAGREALLEAQRGALQGSEVAGFPPPTLLAVTVLTSWTTDNFEQELQIEQPLVKRVELLASLAAQSGIGGCICSPLEVAWLRKNHPHPFQLITPGIRLKGDDIDDQARVMTPLDAINAGASRLVIGRSITKSLDPLASFQRIRKELSAI